MKYFTRFSLRSPAVIVISIFLLFAGGIYSARQLPLESMPDITIPIVTIMTVYPGANPESVAEEVTKPIELAVRGVDGLKSQETTSSQNMSLDILEFDFGADMDKAEEEVEKAVKALDLPEEVKDPQIGRFSFDSVPIMRLSIVSDGSLAGLDTYMRKDMIPQLQAVEGVADVELAAQRDEQIKIRLLPSKLKKYNLTVDQVSGFLAGNNLVLPAGELELGNKLLPVTVGKNFTSIKQLKNLPVPVFPSQADAMKSALTPIADGMKNLGGAVGQLGSAVGQLGKGMSGLAQGMGGLQGQIALLSAANDLQSAIFNDKIALQQATSPAMQAGLRQKIAAEEAGLARLKAQIKSIQGAMSASGGSGSGRRSGGGGFSSSVKKAAKPKVKLIRLGQIAEIKMGSDGEKALSRLNGEPAVSMSILKEADANTVEVSKAVREKMDDFSAAQSGKMRVKVVQDQAESVKESVNGLLREGILGAILAASVILLFLRHWRSTVIACVSIPLSILVALVVLNRMGVSLNIMTLGGLAVAIGRIVDDSIVVIENIYRHHRKRDLEGEELVQKGTDEVAGAITSSSLTTVGVFVPLMMVSGFIGQIFVPFAVAVVSSLLASLLVAVTVVPLMAKFLLKGDKGGHDRGLWMASGYTRVLRWSLDHKLIVCVIGFVTLAGSFGLASKVGSNFIPKEEATSLSVAIELPAGSAFESLDKKTRAVEALLKGKKEVKDYLSTVGAPSSGMAALEGDPSVRKADVFVNLKDDVNASRLATEIRKEVEVMEKPGTISVSEVVDTGGGPTPQLEIIVEGDDLSSLKTATTMVRKSLVGVEGIANISDNLEASKPGLAVTLRAKEAAKKGLTSAQIGGWVNTVLVGRKVMQASIGGEAVDVNLGVKFRDVDKYQELRKLRLMTPSGELIALEKVAKVSETKMPASITKKDGKRYSSINADFTVQDTGSISREVQGILAGLSLPAGIKASQSGDAQRMEEAFGQLGLAMIIAVSMVFLIMVISFGEARTPFAILFALPLATVGTLVALFLSGQQINISSLIGGLMLIGIVVTNAIVLVDRVQKQRRTGIGMRKALLEAGATRLRPVLMTAVATILALVPLAVGMSGGTLISQALAMTVIGGLITGTIATLVLTPVAMEILFSFGDAAGKAERLERRADIKAMKELKLSEKSVKEPELSSTLVEERGGGSPESR